VSKAVTVGADSGAVVRRLLEPRSVAVIGASDDPRKPGARTLRNIIAHGFGGEVFPVSLRSTAIQGIAAYRAIDALPHVPELAILAVPIDSAFAMAGDCARAGIPAVIVLSADQPDSLDHREAISRLRHRFPRTRFLGPSSLGVHGARARFAGNFSTAVEGDFAFAPSDVFIVSQSGGVGAYVLSTAHSVGLPIGGFISTGTEVDLTFAELLRGVIDEYSPSLVLGYVEGTRDDDLFADALRYAQDHGVAVLLLRGGATTVGRQAAERHSGLPPVGDDAWRTRVDSAGGLTVSSIEEMVDIARALIRRRLRDDPRFSIVSASGGAGVLMADAASREGFRLAAWAPAEKLVLARLLPDHAVVDNPIDATGALFSHRSTLRGVLEACVGHDGTDVTVLTLGNMPHIDERLFQEISMTAEVTGKLIAVVWAGGSADAVRRLAQLGVLAFSDAARCAHALRRALDHRAAIDDAGTGPDRI